MKAGLDNRTMAILTKAGYDTEEKIATADPVYLLKLEGFGSGRLDQVNSFLGRESIKNQAKINTAIKLLRDNGYKVEKL